MNELIHWKIFSPFGGGLRGRIPIIILTKKEASVIKVKIKFQKKESPNGVKK